MRAHRTVPTRPITVAQLNANRTNDIMTAALAQCGADILLITEPWWQDIGDGNTISVAGGNYTCLLPMQCSDSNSYWVE